LFSNFMKFDRREIGKIVRCLPDKWNKIRSRYCTDRAKNSPRPAADNVLRVFQISSKSVHFRRERTREHRERALESESNSRLKLNFEPNKYDFRMYYNHITLLGLTKTSLDGFYSAPQCSHCKRCTSYDNSVLSVRSSVRPSVCHKPVLCQNDCM